MCEAVGNGYTDYCEDHAWEHMAVVETEAEWVGYQIRDTTKLFNSFLVQDTEPDYEAFQEISLTILDLHREKKRLEPFVAKAVRAFNYTRERVNVNYITSCDWERPSKERELARQAYEDGRAYRENMELARRANRFELDSYRAPKNGGIHIGETAHQIEGLNMEQRIQLAADTDDCLLLEALSLSAHATVDDNGQTSYFERWSLAMTIVGNWETSATTLNAIARAYSRQLVDGYDIGLYEAIMHHPLLPAELLAELVNLARPKRIKSPQVMRMVASHPASTPGILSEVAEVACDTLGIELLDNPNAPQTVVHACSKSTNPKVRMSLALDEQTDPAILKGMEEVEQDQEVWHALLANPNFPYM